VQASGDVGRGSVTARRDSAGSGSKEGAREVDRMAYADGLLATDETIVRREHQHWIFPFYIAGKWVAIAVLVTIIGFILSQWVFKSDGTGTGIINGTIGFINNVVTIVTVIALAFAVIGFIYSVIQWQSQEYILTSVRVLHVHGVINKQSGDSSLENITDAQIRVPWLGRILGFGDLVVMTASEAGINNLRALRDPIGFKKAMMGSKTERMIELNTPRTAPAAAAQVLPPAAPAVPAEPAAPAAPAAPDPDEVAKTISSLASLRDSGAITPEEFEAKKQELLDRL
jgi:Short C-terminal domain/Bacterial PH domain